MYLIEPPTATTALAARNRCRRRRHCCLIAAHATSTAIAANAATAAVTTAAAARGCRHAPLTLSLPPPPPSPLPLLPTPLGRQMMQELENQYEHRLAVELDRFDKLSEEVEAVQQRCNGLLEAQVSAHARV
jgi:hypothetical protein